MFVSKFRTALAVLAATASAAAVMPVASQALTVRPTGPGTSVHPPISVAPSYLYKLTAKPGHKQEICDMWASQLNQDQANYDNAKAAGAGDEELAHLANIIVRDLDAMHESGACTITRA